ncbi:hypothetical protein MTR11_21760 [Vibrio sp. CCB-PB317]|uniref:DUF6998 domain-containing protein n=1 Tax=Vibrio sp. CCB-PB317 TaxID=2929171 RepID=UPI001FABDA42|nr:hypothetical protein [Vibrio sp. CCB-PB317]MCJ0884310.1 hypothetical protein [Vibrio sp. CCB-PB317]
MDIRIVELLNKYIEILKVEESLGTPATEMRALIGRIGEIYAAIKTDGKLASEVNQHGYDVIQGNGRTLSVKTTGTLRSTISINKRTAHLADDTMVVLYEDGELKVIYHQDTATLVKFEGTLSLYRVSVLAGNPIQMYYTRPRSGDTARVWDICESNQDLSRSEIIEICVAEGINKVTATTQYSDWTNRKRSPLD